MNNTETCLNCNHSYTQCQFNYYHQRYCSRAECQAASKKASQKKWYEKTKLIESQSLSEGLLIPSKSSPQISHLEEKLATAEAEINKLRDVASSLHSSIYDLLSITLGVMMHMTGDEVSEMSPEIIGSRCKKFYLLTQGVLKRPDLMLTTIWDCINNVQKSYQAGSSSANTS